MNLIISYSALYFYFGFLLRCYGFKNILHNILYRSSKPYVILSAVHNNFFLIRILFTDIKHNIFCFLRIRILISDIDCDSRILIQSIFYKICLICIIILAVSKSKYTQTARDSIQIFLLACISLCFTSLSDQNFSSDFQYLM